MPFNDIPLPLAGMRTDDWLHGVSQTLFAEKNEVENHVKPIHIFSETHFDVIPVLRVSRKTCILHTTIQYIHIL